MRILLIAIAVLILSSCSSPTPKGTDNVSSIANTSKALVALFEERQLPFTINYCHEDIDYKIAKAIDSIGLKYKLEGHYPFSKIDANGKFITLISLATTECLVPCVTTIDSNGTLVDQKYLTLDGGGGAGPGYKYSASVTVGKDLTILSVDTIIEFQTTDSTMLPRQGGLCHRKVRSKSGKINGTGIIELSDMKIYSSISIIDTAKFNYW